MRLLDIAIVAAVLSWATPILAQEATPSGDAKNGEKQFMSDGCYQCHGVGGNGANTGPRLSRTALPYDAFLHQLRHPANEMPPYEAPVVSDANAADIYAYLKSRPVQPDPKTLPLLMGEGSK